MRWIGFGALVLSACSLFACGGATINGSDTGGSGGTSSGGSGGMSSGCNCPSGFQCHLVSGSYSCVADPSTGGAGGTAGAAGAGGTAGSAGAGGTTAECSAAQKASAQPSGTPVGFGSANPSGSAKVAQISADSLQLTTPSGPLEFKWVGPDLTGHFTQDEPVAIGRQNGWDYVAGLSNLAAARHDENFVAPKDIPPIPMAAGPYLAYGTECTFTEASGGCGQPPGTVKLLTVDATTGAGIVSAGQGKTIQFMDWQIHNAGSAQYPAYSNGSCVVDAAFSSAITVLGPSPVNGGP